MSSLPFILVMEVLGCTVSKAVEDGLISGFKVGYPSFSLSHLLFADDTILFCNATVDQLLRIMFFSFVLKQ